MKHNPSRWLLLCVAAIFFAVGIPYWFIPYGKVNLPDAVLGPGLIVVALSALLLRLYRAASFWRVTWTAGASVALAVMARVLVEGVRDPTSHNLWPLELIIALVVGFTCAVAGAIVGSLSARLFPNRQGKKDL
jgi:peptidoglycan/LPS O-acetylase OafA/YrhL